MDNSAYFCYQSGATKIASVIKRRINRLIATIEAIYIVIVSLYSINHDKFVKC